MAAWILIAGYVVGISFSLWSFFYLLAYKNRDAITSGDRK
jgi:hypothetical protein